MRALVVLAIISSVLWLTVSLVAPLPSNDQFFDAWPDDGGLYLHLDHYRHADFIASPVYSDSLRDVVLSYAFRAPLTTLPAYRSDVQTLELFRELVIQPSIDRAQKSSPATPNPSLASLIDLNFAIKHLYTFSLPGPTLVPKPVHGAEYFAEVQDPQLRGLLILTGLVGDLDVVAENPIAFAGNEEFDTRMSAFAHDALRAAAPLLVDYPLAGLAPGSVNVTKFTVGAAAQPLYSDVVDFQDRNAALDAAHFHWKFGVAPYIRLPHSCTVTAGPTGVSADSLFSLLEAPTSPFLLNVFDSIWCELDTVLLGTRPAYSGDDAAIGAMIALMNNDLDRLNWKYFPWRPDLDVPFALVHKTTSSCAISCGCDCVYMMCLRQSLARLLKLPKLRLNPIVCARAYVTLAETACTLNWAHEHCEALRGLTLHFQQEAWEDLRSAMPYLTAFDADVRESHLRYMAGSVLLRPLWSGIDRKTVCDRLDDMLRDRAS
ncbi:MAG: hypothetical protein ACKVU1_02585 [bacterium]